MCVYSLHVYTLEKYSYKPNIQQVSDFTLKYVKQTPLLPNEVR
jgi:hypothetical protein